MTALALDDDEPLHSDNVMCECSWGWSDNTAASPLGFHTRGKHREKGAGRCLGRDSYGRPCECPGYIPMTK
jgi:hypothetical protein